MFSSDFNSSWTHLKDGAYVYKDLFEVCSLSKVTLASTGQVTSEFANAVCHLNETVIGENIDSYINFLDNWGTVC